MRDIIITNEKENAIDYLQKAAFYFNHREDDYWFKWLMISLHGALYGFGVCAIKGINIERVLNKKLKKTKFEQKKKELIELYEKQGFKIDDESLLDCTAQYSLSKLLDIWDILECCQNESYMKQRLDSKVLCLTDSQKKAIKKVIDYRNDFAHFKPAEIYVINEYDEWIIKEVIDVIKFLALESGNVNYFTEESRIKVNQQLELLELEEKEDLDF